MMQFRFEEVAMLLGCPEPFGSGSIIGMHFDSRLIQSGQLFVAVRGEHRDGHDFLEMAKQNGAIAALVDHPVSIDLPQFIVSDTVQAMGKLASSWRSRFSLPIIGLTGSNGKTTTKNAIARILSELSGDAQHVLATEGNFNNHLGLPLMLSKLNASHHYAVIEMGMNHFNEISYLTQLTHPNVSLITNAGMCHLEGVGSVEGVAQAKAEIFSGLSQTGIAILNRDDEFYSYWLNAVESRTVVTFGFHPEADVRAECLSPQVIRVLTPNGEITVRMPLLGKHNALNALAATASVLAVSPSIPLSCIQRGLESLKPEKGRLNVHLLRDGVHVLDDTYNANPLSLLAAVDSMSTFSGKKIVVLGDLKELGTEEIRIHADLGCELRSKGIDHLFAYGSLTEHTASAFGSSFYFRETDQLVSALLPFLNEEVVVLVKGSRSMRMEKIVGALLEKQIA